MQTIKKGFTLIELLVVIGVLAVLMAGVVALIDPRDKMLQAADAKVQSDIAQIASASQASAAQATDGGYPATLASLTTTGELKVIPVPPTQAAYGTAYTYVVTAAAPRTQAVVGARVFSRKYTSLCAANSPYWVWHSDNGRACGMCLGAAPVLGSTTCTF